MRAFLVAGTSIGITLSSLVGMIISGALVGSHHWEIAAGYSFFGILVMIVTIMVLK